VFKRLYDWVKGDVFKRIFDAVWDDPNMEYTVIDVDPLLRHWFE